MSCDCSICYSLGCQDAASSTAYTRSREEIELHAEIHRTQIRFIIEENSSLVVSEGKKKSIAENGISRSNVGRTFKDHEKRKALEDHCRAISMGCPDRKGDAMYCNLCKSVKAVCSGQHIYAPYAFRHAQIHMDKTAYICRHCDHRNATGDAMRNHLKSQHKIVADISDHFDDESDKYFEQMKDTITKCFGIRRKPSTSKQDIRDNVSAVVENVRLKQHASDFSRKQTLIALYRSIFPNRPKGSDRSVTCHLCRAKKVVYTSYGTVMAKTPLAHARFHLGRFFYFCKLCDARCTRIDYMLKHLRETHQVIASNAAGSYVDKTSDFAQEANDMITKCFGRRDAQRSVRFKERQSPVEVKPKLIGPKCQSKPSHHDRLSKIRQDRCWRLVKHVRKLGRILCKRCGVEVPFSPRQADAPSQLRHHVLSMHMPKLATTASQNMYDHVKRRHHSASVIGHFDDDFHDEIMSELSACFDSSGSSSGTGNVRTSGDSSSILATRNDDQAASATYALPVTVSASTTDDSHSAVGTSKDKCPIPSSTNDNVSSTRMKRYQCHVCQTVFVHELIFKKHMACFHSEMP